MPEECVKHYEAAIKGGGIVMGVKSRNDAHAKLFAEDWKKHNAEHVYP